jgi:lysophospholipase L1-like esterase
MRLSRPWMATSVAVLCVSLVGPVAGASAHAHKKARLSAKAKRVERGRLMRMVKKNPRVISKRSFVKRASLVNFKLPITVRLRSSNVASNPNSANLDLGASLGKRQIGLGGSLAGEIVFHDSYDGGALGNVDVTLNPGPKSLTTTSVPLLWNTDVSSNTTSLAPTFHLGSGTAGCGNFHGNLPLNLGGHTSVPWYATQADVDTNNPGGDVPDTPGVDDPSRLVNSAAVGSADNLGPSANPFPYSSGGTPGGFSAAPSPADSVLRTAPLSLQVAAPGTEVNQTDLSPNGPQGSQNVVLGKSGGQANLFGNIPGKSSGIDITINLATRINSILRAVDPDYVPLISSNPWPTTWSACRQAYTGAVQNYITGVHLKGNLHISPAITPDGALRIAKATLTSADPAQLALAACIYPYSLYTAENNNSDVTPQTVSSYTSGGQLPTNEFVARSAPNVDCGVPATRLVQDAPALALAAANAANGYTTGVKGDRVSVAGEITTAVSADILVGDTDDPPATPPLSNDYVALGDSIAYGYQSALFASNPNPAVFNFGYVDLFGNYLKRTNGSLGVSNFGCPGETTDSLLSGFNPAASLCGKPTAQFPYALLHVPYGAGNTQIQAAKSYLTAHPGSGGSQLLVTLDIGANDLLDFMAACGFPAPSASTCIANGLSGEFTHITGNINATLAQLKQVAPNARYIVMGLYNPYPLVINVGGLNGDTAIAQLNSQIKQIAVNNGARFVDPLPTFNPNGAAGGSEAGDLPTICALTGMCPGGPGALALGYNPNPGSGADIHPSRKGYAALASLFDSASGF